MTEEEYILLYEKYSSGLCSDEEIKQLEEYQDAFRLTDFEWDDEIMGKSNVIKKHLYTGIEEKMTMRVKLNIYPVLRYSAAAVLLILCAGIFYFYNADHKNLAATNPRFKNDIKAGSNKAILVLENGSKIILDDAKNGILTKQGSVEVRKDNNGHLIYTIVGTHSSGAPTYNTISTPLGGQYNVILPDGTSVWLNAASSLRFPTSFTGKERKVELSGEAYFEVAENKDFPFRVQLSDMSVKVLGTHFNIMAYKDENKINTTLLEGSVQIVRGEDSEYLTPGKQGSLSKSSGAMSVNDVNVDNAIAWKNGYFVFDNEDIKTIMKKVARWYNVEVDYAGNVNNRDFVGRVSRAENVSEVLNTLELTEVVHFKIEGRRITVMP